MFPSSKEKSPTHARMNSTNLYVTTTQIILKADSTNPQSWQDLYRLIPYLRNSLCCVVCSMLLVDPLTPANAQCQHHLCRSCKGGRKKIKPQCESCKECIDYNENKSLRILMQLYKKMCFNVINSKIFKCIKIQAIQPSPGFQRGANNLIQLIKEGAMFQDDYESRGGLPKSSYSILPCIYSNSSSTQNLTVSQQNQTDTIKTQNASNHHRTSLYSVVYPGSGNKITIKRKPNECTNSSANNVFISSNISSLQPKEFAEKVVFKKPCIKPKKGCRCGNATATPGKLTCCGQRCPCYVESKACINCKCRGCRNPHRPDGNKVMPFIPELESPQIVVPPIQDIHVQQIQVLTPSVPSTLNDESMGGAVKLDAIQLDTHFNAESLNNQFKAYKFLDNSFDPIHSLGTSDLLSYGVHEGDEATDIIVP